MVENISAYKTMIKSDIEKARLMLDDLLPSRERSLVRTKLDEAEMWLERIPEDHRVSD